MPMPSKFTAERRSRIIQLVTAGASLREAAKGVGIDHATLLGWLKKGRTAHPSGYLHEFYREVESARGGSPELVELKSRWENPDTAWLMKWIEPELDLGRVQEEVHVREDFTEPDPFEVRVVLSTGEPLEPDPVGPAA